MSSRLTFVTVFVSVCAALAAQRAPETRVDTDADTGFSDRPQIEVVGDAVYVVWEDDRNGFKDIYFNRSLDRGATWLASDVRLDTDPMGVADSLAVQVAAWGSHVYVVWNDYRNNGSAVRFNRSSDRGETWLAHDVELAAQVAPATGSPQICELANRIAVTWADERASFGRSDVYMKLSTDFGATWGGDVRLNTNSPGSTNAEYPSIDMDGPMIYVAWEDDTRTGTTEGVYINRSADGGATWEAADVQLDDNNVESENPIVACLGQHVSVVWEGNSQTDVFCNSSADFGQTWLPAPVRVNTEPMMTEWSVAPTVDVEGAKTYVAWDDRRSGEWEPYFNYSWNGGASFAPSDQRLNSGTVAGSTAARHVQIESWGNDVHAVWKDFRQGPPQIYYNRSDDGGATFVADVPLSGAVQAFSVDWARLAVEGEAVGVVWDTGPSIQYTIPFGALPRGTGTAGTGGLVPLLRADGKVIRGESVSIDTTFGLSNGSSALLIGFSPATMVDMPFLGGQVLVAPQFTAPATLDLSGGASMTLNVSTDPVWLGVNLNFQAVILDAAAPAGLSMSNAVELWIG